MFLSLVNIFCVVGIGVDGGNQAVVGIVGKATVGCVGDIACGIVRVILLGQHHVGQILHRTLGYTVEVIISVTQLGRICKIRAKNPPPPKQGENKELYYGCVFIDSFYRCQNSINYTF